MAGSRIHREPVSVQEAFEVIKADYSAAKPSPLRRTRRALGGNADAHYANELEYFKMMEYARDMDRNDVIIGVMIERAVTNTIQQGFICEPDTGDKGLDKDLKARFGGWGEDKRACDSEGERTFWELEDKSFRGTLVDGDNFVIPLDDGTIQFREAHRARTPQGTDKNVVHGVLLDERRRRKEYWFTREPNAPLDTRIQLVRDMERVPAFDPDTGFPNVFHVVNPKRFSQTRGVSALVPCMDTAGVTDDLLFAKLVQAQHVSCFVGAITTDEGVTPNDLQVGGRTGVTATDGSQSIIERITPGMFLRLKPGQKLSGFSPNVPNAEFFDHVNMLLMFMALNVGLSLVEFLKDCTKTNFSGIRGAQGMDRVGFKRNQKWFASRFHTPIYLHKVRNWLAKSVFQDGLGEVAARLAKSGRLFQHSWGYPRWESIQPVDDAMAVAMRVVTGQSSLREELLNNGRNIEEVVTDTVNDNAFAIGLAIAAAEKLKKLTGGESVTWRDLLPRDLPRGMNVMAQTNDSLDIKNNSETGAAAKPAPSSGGNGGSRAA